jgi:hypothetical protein
MILPLWATCRRTTPKGPNTYSGEKVISKTGTDIGKIKKYGSIYVFIPPAGLGTASASPSNATTCLLEEKIQVIHLSVCMAGLW